MSLIFVSVISFLGIILGKLIFKKWINHLTIYSFIWGGLIFLYELKLLPYDDIIPLAWFFIIVAFIAFICGILTVTTSRNLYSGEQVLVGKSDMFLPIFTDNGRTLKYSIICFSLIGLYAGIQHWLVLLDKFGSFASILINANKIYSMNNKGEITGIIPYISSFGYVGVFLAGIYTAYKGRFSPLSFLPLVGIVVKDLASFGRAGMLLAIMQFIFTFFLFRHLLKNDLRERFKFFKSNAVLAFIIIFVFLIVAASLVRVSRISFESYQGASKVLRQLENNSIISPSIYLYLSSDIGVLSQYLYSENESAEFGQNTFLTIYGFLAKIGAVEKPELFQKGYYIPMWTNTGTFIREIHADFGVIGVILVPYLLGLLSTWLWYKFYQGKNLIVFALLVYLYLIIGFSFLVMVTRLPSWNISLFIIVIILPILEKISLMAQIRLEVKPFQSL